MSIDPRRLVGVKAERVTNISSTDFPGHYPGEDHSWDAQKFKQNLKVQVQRVSNRSIDFDLVGVDASIANALRRILLAEVPTIAIEHVYVYDNTTVIQDEVLAHRMGLIPLDVDPDMMTTLLPGDDLTDRNTLVFKVDFECTRNPRPPPGATEPEDLYLNHELLSKHLSWHPEGEQKTYFGNHEPQPTNGDIVLAKLRPGQRVQMDLHAIKSVGKDHAKFSPVATASYRILPHISILKPIPKEHAKKFQQCFAPGVVDIDPTTHAVSINQKFVRNDTVTREVLRHPEFEGYVELSRVRDHFLFNIESESAYEPARLFKESIKVMKAKLATVRASVELLRNPTRSEDVVMGS
ncbi:hypothetical protein CYLTODRAFT_350265 [Cylindrobasidium torrendii FP15055 ss-10]|uniref:DNA-directed RNA polymerases I and III subunit RPAC1 n=1 Tax=Cylindrobasidium torrendii FP15055 ss-10 TaxID=1314674 RepID=A0A0D7BG44_9AGAR|nr:hypothetical protein CYLTODRAFT_350265 [Cylindrobasidium torrendii FP15055 ss-10]